MPDARLARARETLPDDYEFLDCGPDAEHERAYTRVALQVLMETLRVPTLTRMYDHDFTTDR